MFATSVADSNDFYWIRCVQHPAVGTAGHKYNYANYFIVYTQGGGCGIQWLSADSVCAARFLCNQCCIQLLGGRDKHSRCIQRTRYKVSRRSTSWFKHQQTLTYSSSISTYFPLANLFSKKKLQC
jgi:hypothetical protein